MKELCEKLAEQYAEDKSKAYYIDKYGERTWYMTKRGEYSKEDFLAGYQAAKDQLADADKVMPQWISVEERLPEDEREVLVVYCGEGIQDVHMSWYEGDEFGWATTGYVSHWMELPAPPKEEK